jgi:hypothetical protein
MDMLTLSGLALGIIKVLAFVALGLVVLGAVVYGLCDLFECRKWRRDQGRTEVWRLMH